MAISEDELLHRLRATFTVEAAEHVQTITDGVLALERTPAIDEQRRLLETVFRAAHSLKGAARAVDFTAVESLCQSLESLFADWRRQKTAPSCESLDSVHRTLAAVGAAMAVPDTPRALAVGSRRTSSEPSRGLVVAEAAVAMVQGPAPRVFPVEDTVRISVARLDARLLEAEEMLTAKLMTSQRADDLRRLAGRFDAWRKDWSAIEPEARALRQAIDRPVSGFAPRFTAGMTRLLAFLDRNVDHLAVLEGHVTGLSKTADLDRHVIGKLVDGLLEESKELLLLPFATLAATFPKVVRDLCRDEGKEADFVVRGEAVEMDKRILEAMKDPLIHLLRNAIVHGIETPDERQRSGKPPRATITLAASRGNRNTVELLVSDDGKGIDAEKVRGAVVEHGLLSADEARRLADPEAHRLIFESDVSTSRSITRLSGRGLGLAIVREQAEKLGGTVAVESRMRHGARFIIALPATLATFRGILVEAAQRVFIVPTFEVERVARVQADGIQTVEGRETVSLNGRAVALAHLDDVLELPRTRSDDARTTVTVMVLGSGDLRTAFAVDAVLEEQEVLVKPLRPPLSRVRNISGATVLGSGKVAPILNVSDLLMSARKNRAAGTRAVARPPPAPAAARAVLVAEDSITSRILIKSILESAGYRVKTAADGLEAFALLRAERFDLLVSDVEMPRLNGFDLTMKIRADAKLTELPVVLVTALETPEDRERGVDAGANAYIVKSRFDQSDLLDAIRRLL